MRQFGILAAFCLIIACRKENITTDTIIKDDPPTQIESAEISGIISSTDGVLANAEVQVYEGEKIVGTVRTDKNGQFSTANLPIRRGAIVTLQATKEGFASNAKRLKANSAVIGNVKMRLTPSRQAAFPTSKHANAGSENLIVLSGYITNPAGKPVLSADLLFLYNVKYLHSNSFESDAQMVSIDENGYYEVLVPKDSVLNLLIFHNSTNNQHYYCNGGFLNKQENQLLPGYYTELIGPFTSDTQLPTYSNGYTPENVAVINCRILDCFGKPVTRGHVAVSYPFTSGVSGTITSFIPLNSEGKFKFSIDLCNGPLSNISVAALDSTTAKKSIPQVFTLGQSINLGDIPACN